jgi:putative transposase
MKGRRHTPEQVVRKLHEADKLIGQGKDLAAVLKHLEVSEQTYYRWRKRYGELSPDDAKRLRQLEGENARLKKLVADQALDIDMLKEINRGNF